MQKNMAVKKLTYNSRYLEQQQVQPYCGKFEAALINYYLFLFQYSETNKSLMTTLLHTQYYFKAHSSSTHVPSPTL